MDLRLHPHLQIQEIGLIDLDAGDHLVRINHLHKRHARPYFLPHLHLAHAPILPNRVQHRHAVHR